MTHDGPGSRSLVGLAIDEHDMPGWASAHLEPGQFGRGPCLPWILLLCKSAALEPTRKHLAHRLFVYVFTVKEGRPMEWSPGLATLGRQTSMSERTVEASIRDLERQGWLLVARRHRYPNTYRLAWPVEDCLSPATGPEVCGEMRAKGGICTRRAGFGTATPGVGPCRHHGKPVPIEPQPLRSNPVDNVSPETGLTATTAAFDRNGCMSLTATDANLDRSHCGGVDQELLRGVDQTSNPPVPAQPPVQARATSGHDGMTGVGAGAAGHLPASAQLLPVWQHATTADVPKIETSGHAAGPSDDEISATLAELQQRDPERHAKLEAEAKNLIGWHLYPEHPPHWHTSLAQTMYQLLTQTNGETP